MAARASTSPVRGSTRAVRWAAFEPSVAFVDGDRSDDDDEGLAGVGVGEAGEGVGGGEPSASAGRSRWRGCPGSSARGAA